MSVRFFLLVDPVFGLFMLSLEVTTDAFEDRDIVLPLPVAEARTVRYLGGRGDESFHYGSE